ncbi:MAG: lysophospholipid acyltransferase family protein [Promethearchaeota archaeon]
MVLTELNYKKESNQGYNKQKYIEIGQEGEEEQLFQKRHHNFLYKLLKWNPFDATNDLWRKLLEHLNLIEQHDELQWWAAYIWVKESMRRLWDYSVEYQDKVLPLEYGPAIIIGNHQSHLDPFFIGGSVNRRIRWMSKEENFQTPIVRTLFKNLGAFELKRGTGDQKAWEVAKEILRNGGWVGIFPEGTRTIDGSLGEFRTGAVRLAIEMGVPIIPTYVIGSREALPKGKLVMKPTKVKVRVGKPIYYDDYKDRSITYPEAKALAEKLREEVIKLKDGVGFGAKNEISKELSIGSPSDMIKKSSSKGIKGKIKHFSKQFLQLIDDSWYALLKSLEVFDLREKFQETIFHFSDMVVHNWCKLMIPYRVIDYDQYLPKEGGALICCNHNSEWDVIILATSIGQYGRILYQMAKDSLFRIPIVNAWVRTHHAFPLRRGEHDIGSFEYAKERLIKGDLVVIYPEGTTNSGGGHLLPGHTGAIRAAIEAKVPIIPVGITGTENIYPKHGKMLNFGKGCILKAGEPFREHEKYFDSARPPNYNDLKELTAKLMERIKKLMLYDSPDV